MIILVVLIAIYLAVLLYIYTMQRAMIFPSHFSREKPYELPSHLAYKVTNPDGITLEGFWQKNGSKSLIIWFEGNSDNVNWVASRLEFFKDYDIAGLNYQGYGASGGTPSQDAIFADALHIYDTLSPNYTKIILIGRSLGTGVATFVSSKRAVDGVVLITPYDSIAQIASEKYSFLPVKLLIKHPFESTKYASKSSAKFAVLEVLNDTVTPNSGTKRLIRHIKNLQYIEVLDGTTHGAVTNDERFIPFVQKALKELE